MSDTSEAAVLYEVKDEIAYITINRPEQRNAMNAAVADRFIEIWERFESDPDVKVGLLKAAGKDFCVGYDLSPENEKPRPYHLHSAYPMHGVKVFKPLVAAVQGYVLGAGYAFGIRGADITVAADTAIIGFPEARAGLAMPPIDYLPYMPFKPSLEFMLLAWKGGEFQSAQRAYELGLINKVVAEDQLLDEALRYCDLLKRIPPLYVKTIKRGHYKAIRPEFLEREMEYLEFIYPQDISADKVEAAQAFREKREPRFTGR
jgi:enoyl-CoA hydratase